MNTKQKYEEIITVLNGNLKGMDAHFLFKAIANLLNTRSIAIVDSEGALHTFDDTWTTGRITYNSKDDALRIDDSMQKLNTLFYRVLGSYGYSQLYDLIKRVFAPANTALYFALILVQRCEYKLEVRDTDIVIHGKGSVAMYDTATDLFNKLELTPALPVIYSNFMASLKNALPKEHITYLASEEFI